MILKINIDTDHIRTNFAYKSALMGFYYKTMSKYYNEKFMRSFHDQTMIKYVVMSDLLGDKFKVTNKTQLNIYDNIHFYIASFYDKLVEPFMYIDHIKIGESKFNVDKIEIIRYTKLYNEFESLSLVNLTKTIYKNNKKYYQRLNVQDSEYITLLERNIKKKYSIAYGENIDFDLSVSPIRTGLFYIKDKRKNKMIPIRGWYIKLNIKSKNREQHRKLQRIITEMGIGYTNLAGFGFMKPKS